MEVFFLSVLGVFGLLFGSFASVIIYRLKSGEKGMFLGRSHCSSCNTVLKAFDLIPLFSYLFHSGSCRHCKKSVSIIYPFLEACSALLFMCIGYFLIDFQLLLSGNIPEFIKLAFYILLAFFTIVYVFYDILFLEIPESILFITIILSFFALVSDSFFGTQILPYTSYSGFDAYSFLSVLIFIIAFGGFYTILLKGLDEIYDLLILGIIGTGLLCLGIFIYDSFFTFSLYEGLVSAFAIFLFFFTQIVISRGAWLGGGDLRIALLMGLMLGLYGSWYGILATYMAGSVIGIILISYKKIKKPKEKVSTVIPFGPFLAIGMFIVLFYYDFIHMLISI